MEFADLAEKWRQWRAMAMGKRVLLELQDSCLRVRAMAGERPLGPMVQLELPEGICAGGMPLKPTALGDFLGDWLLEQDLLHSRLVVALPAAAAHWRVIVWPFSEQPDEPIEALLTLDPPMDLPFPLAEADLDLKPLPPDCCGSGSPESLLVAAEPKLVEAWLGVFEVAGVDGAQFKPAQLCWMAALQQRLGQVPAGKLVVLLVDEAPGARVIFWLRGQPVFERQLEGERTEWVNQICRWIGLYRRHDPGATGLLLWTARSGHGEAGFEKTLADDLADGLGQGLEEVVPQGYESLVLAGLAQLA